MEYSNLILNAQSYSKSELLELSQKKLNNSLTEEWQLRVFSFIQEWLDDIDNGCAQKQLIISNRRALIGDRAFEEIKQNMAVSLRECGATR